MSCAPVQELKTFRLPANFRGRPGGEPRNKRYAAKARAYAERTFDIDRITRQFLEIFAFAQQRPFTAYAMVAAASAGRATGLSPRRTGVRASSGTRTAGILIALGPAHLANLQEVIRRVDRSCVPIRVVVDFGGNLFARERMFQFGRLQLVNVSRSPTESLAYEVGKRAFDILFASLAILLASPLIAVIAVTIKLTSPGPIFFRQERVGLHGRLFSMLKFRSMKVAPPGESDTCWTVKNDPRRTAFGAWLRATSLDELPQFFNVLQGDMSVVGPRPERPHFAQQFLQGIHTYNSRHLLKVGITGWAQVNGWRGDTSIKKRVEYDLYYLRNWSFLFDLRIIFLTLWSGLFNRNAY